MVQAMSTGHDGSLSTCHANAPLDALRRLETMILVADAGLAATGVREQLVAAIDLVMHVVRAPDGTRRLARIAEVEPFTPLAVRDLACLDMVVALPRREPRRPGVSLPDERWRSR
jgi:pilus assembly protein CpaF